jgi:xanthine dehydrogenase/oxidase
MIDAGVHISYELKYLQVTTQGQVVGAVVAVDQITAQRAAKLVKVEYKNLEPIIITIEVRRMYSFYYIF